MNNFISPVDYVHFNGRLMGATLGDGRKCLAIVNGRSITKERAQNLIDFLVAFRDQPYDYKDLPTLEEAMEELPSIALSSRTWRRHARWKFIEEDELRQLTRTEFQAALLGKMLQESREDDDEDSRVVFLEDIVIWKGSSPIEKLFKKALKELVELDLIEMEFFPYCKIRPTAIRKKLRNQKIALRTSAREGILWKHGLADPAGSPSSVSELGYYQGQWYAVSVEDDAFFDELSTRKSNRIPGQHPVTETIIAFGEGAYVDGMPEEEGIDPDDHAEFWDAFGDGAAAAFALFGAHNV